ncbi:DnaJ-domain-containing protein [Pluteus cervinus]|uniref:DnaJ-domain-containing protein n=1 Tax=Pluteus cervinus TaxID=181527 RepID=A0ACD3AHU6_9AGAR|nr:DnaJ-domain-containing protein [Pluteus cervinus]
MGSSVSTSAHGTTEYPTDSEPARAQASDFPEEFTDDMTYYQVLGIQNDASDEDIKRAYRRSALRHHPDKNPNDVEPARRRFETVQLAYETLSNPAMRDSYDISVSMRAASGEREAPYASNHTGANADNINIPGSWSWTTPKSASTSGPRTWSEWAFGRSEPKRSRLFSFQEYLQSAGEGHIIGVTHEDILQWLEGLENIDQAHQDMYSVFSNFYQCLAYDEAQWGGRPLPTRFGTAESVWDRSDSDVPQARGVYEIKDFYHHWLQFKTSKSFDWVVRYVAPGETNARVDRFLRNKNKPYQVAARNAFNELIQSLTLWVMHHDPRFIIHLRYEALVAYQAHQLRQQFYQPDVNIVNGGETNTGSESRRSKKKKRNKNNSTIH